MILGVGVDLVALPALAEQVGLPGSTFLSSVLTARERRVVDSRVRAEGGSPGAPAALAPHVGARWAAKEAFVKAWSTALTGAPPPIPPEELLWSEIEVVQDHWGRPMLVLHGRVAREVARTVGGTEEGVRWHLSLSHDGDHALAAVILERSDGDGDGDGHDAADGAGDGASAAGRIVHELSDGFPRTAPGRTD